MPQILETGVGDAGLFADLLPGPPDSVACDLGEEKLGLLQPLARDPRPKIGNDLAPEGDASPRFGRLGATHDECGRWAVELKIGDSQVGNLAPAQSGTERQRDQEPPVTRSLANPIDLLFSTGNVP